MRIAVVGAGLMGTTHARAWAAMPGATLAGILAPEAPALAQRLGTAAVADWAGLVALRPDVVDICLPTDLHCRYALAAAAAGMHVVVEKPIALSLADGREMVAACAAAGVRLLVGHVVRFFPEYARARALVRQGALGRLGIIRTFRGGGAPRGVDDWFADPSRSGGLLVDLLVHDFDWLRWTCGEVRRVFCRTADDRHALVTLRLQGGAIAEVEGTWARPDGFATAFEVAGDRGALAHDSRTAVPLAVRLRQAAPDGGAGGTELPLTALAVSPYERELAHFLSCLRGEATPVVGAEDALAALAVALAARESAERGVAVEVSA